MGKHSFPTVWIHIGYIAGILGGIGIGLFFHVVERICGISVYTLLLNVDYIPVLKDMVIPENIEFLMHLFLSIIISLGLLHIILSKKISSNKIYLFTISSSLLIAFLLFPTTALSERTPELTNISALIIWLIGHFLYGWILGVLFNKYK